MSFVFYVNLKQVTVKTRESYQIAMFAPRLRQARRA